jgi:hypothetical protein
LGDAIPGGMDTRKAGLFGIHGGHVNYTDGRFVYMRAPKDFNNQPLFDYTLFPTRMKSLFDSNELQKVELVPPFSFTKGCPVLKIKKTYPKVPAHFETLLYDLQNDPFQDHPIQDMATEGMMVQELIRLMQENDAPQEQFERLGLTHNV